MFSKFDIVIVFSRLPSPSPLPRGVTGHVTHPSRSIPHSAFRIPHSALVPCRAV